MLEGLDSVDWRRLTACGDAADVPDLIRALSWNDEDERGEALEVLFDRILHQGTVYEATTFAVPFLIELLDDTGVEGKDGILQLLSSIAEGCSSTDILNVHRFWVELGPGAGQEQAERDARLARELGWARAASEAVEAGVRTYLDLLSNDAPEVRIRAAYVLGRCRGRNAQVVPELAARVPLEKNARSRAALILALGSLEAAVGDQHESDALLARQIGPEEHPVVRLAAAMCLARGSPDEPAPEVLDALIASTGSAWSDFEELPWCENGDVAVDVGEALAGHPQARLRFLVRLLDSEHPEVRRGARLAVEDLCHLRRSVTALAGAMLGERVFVGDLADRRGTVEILSRLGSAAAPAATSLGVALGEDDPQLRAHAAIALARLRDPRAIPALIALLNEERFFSKIARALGWFGAAARDAVPALLDVLDREPPREPVLAFNWPIHVATALGQIGPDARAAVPALIALMKQHPHAQLATALALAQIGGTEARAAVPVLKMLLRSQDELVRIRAARTLWQIDRRADPVLPLLIELLQPGKKNRWPAAEALGEMGDAAREAVPALRVCLDDTSSFHAMWVRLSAARALWRIDRDTDASLPVLIALLRDPSAVGSRVATQAAEALGEMGRIAQEAIPVLRAASAGDMRPFGGAADEIVIEDEAFCSAVAESLRRIEGDDG